jgi:hypothetical protein
MATARLNLNGVRGLSNLRKVAVVLAGYLVAFLIAFTVDYVLTRLNHSPDANGGMQAFGDMLRFLGMFGILALFPTALALYFLRSVEKFWTIFSIAALALAATGPFAALLMGRPKVAPWAVIAGFVGLLEILGAPLFGIGFVFCAVIAPGGRSRWRLLAAAGIEFAVVAFGFFWLIFLSHWP